MYPYSKVITVFRNGDPYSSASCAVVGNSLNNLFREISRKLPGPYTVIKHLYKVGTGEKVNAMEDLHHKQSYIATGNEKLLSMTIKSITPTPSKLVNKSSNQVAFVLRTRNTTIIHVFRNGIVSQPRKFVLTMSDIENWTSAMHYIGATLNLTYEVHNLYTVNGTKINSSNIVNGGYYVAVGYNEKYKSKNYMQIICKEENDKKPCNILPKRELVDIPSADSLNSSVEEKKTIPNKIVPKPSVQENLKKPAINTAIKKPMIKTNIGKLEPSSSKISPVKNKQPAKLLTNKSKTLTDASTSINRAGRNPPNSPKTIVSKSSARSMNYTMNNSASENLKRVESPLDSKNVNTETPNHAAPDPPMSNNLKLSKAIAFKPIEANQYISVSKTIMDPQSVVNMVINNQLIANKSDSDMAASKLADTSDISNNAATKDPNLSNKAPLSQTGKKATSVKGSKLNSQANLSKPNSVTQNRNKTGQSKAVKPHVKQVKQTAANTTQSKGSKNIQSASSKDALINKTESNLNVETPSTIKADEAKQEEVNLTNIATQLEKVVPILINPATSIPAIVSLSKLSLENIEHSKAYQLYCETVSSSLNNQQPVTQQDNNSLEQKEAGSAVTSNENLAVTVLKDPTFRNLVKFVDKPTRFTKQSEDAASKKQCTSVIAKATAKRKLLTEKSGHDPSKPKKGNKKLHHHQYLHQQVRKPPEPIGTGGIFDPEKYVKQYIASLDNPTNDIGNMLIEEIDSELFQADVGYRSKMQNAVNHLCISTDAVDAAQNLSSDRESNKLGHGLSINTSDSQSDKSDKSGNQLLLNEKFVRNRKAKSEEVPPLIDLNVDEEPIDKIRTSVDETIVNGIKLTESEILWADKNFVIQEKFNDGQFGVISESFYNIFELIAEQCLGTVSYTCESAGQIPQIFERNLVFDDDSDDVVSDLNVKKNDTEIIEKEDNADSNEITTTSETVQNKDTIYPNDMIELSDNNEDFINDSSSETNNLECNTQYLEDESICFDQAYTTTTKEADYDNTSLLDAPNIEMENKDDKNISAADTIKNLEHNSESEKKRQIFEPAIRNDNFAMCCKIGAINYFGNSGTPYAASSITTNEDKLECPEALANLNEPVRCNSAGNIGNRLSIERNLSVTSNEDKSKLLDGVDVILPWAKEDNRRPIANLVEYPQSTALIDLANNFSDASTEKKSKTLDSAPADVGNTSNAERNVAMSERESLTLHQSCDSSSATIVDRLQANELMADASGATLASKNIRECLNIRKLDLFQQNLSDNILIIDNLNKVKESEKENIIDINSKLSNQNLLLADISNPNIDLIRKKIKESDIEVEEDFKPVDFIKSTNEVNPSKKLSTQILNEIILNIVNPTEVYNTAPKPSAPMLDLNDTDGYIVKEDMLPMHEEINSLEAIQVDMKEEEHLSSNNSVEETTIENSTTNKHSRIMDTGKVASVPEIAVMSFQEDETDALTDASDSTKVNYILGEDVDEEEVKPPLENQTVFDLHLVNVEYAKPIEFGSMPTSLSKTFDLATTNYLEESLNDIVPTEIVEETTQVLQMVNNKFQENNNTLFALNKMEEATTELRKLLQQKRVEHCENKMISENPNVDILCYAANDIEPTIELLEMPQIGSRLNVSNENIAATLSSEDPLSNTGNNNLTLPVDDDVEQEQQQSNPSNTSAGNDNASNVMDVQQKHPQDEFKEEHPLDTIEDNCGKSEQHDSVELERNDGDEYISQNQMVKESNKAKAENPATGLTKPTADIKNISQPFEVEPEKEFCEKIDHNERIFNKYYRKSDSAPTAGSLKLENALQESQERENNEQETGSYSSRDDWNTEYDFIVKGKISQASFDSSVDEVGFKKLDLEKWKKAEESIHNKGSVSDHAMKLKNKITPPRDSNVEATSLSSSVRRNLSNVVHSNDIYKIDDLKDNDKDTPKKTRDKSLLKKTLASEKLASASVKSESKKKETSASKKGDVSEMKDIKKNTSVKLEEKPSMKEKLKKQLVEAPIKAIEEEEEDEHESANRDVSSTINYLLDQTMKRIMHLDETITKEANKTVRTYKNKDLTNITELVDKTIEDYNNTIKKIENFKESIDKLSSTTVLEFSISADENYLAKEQKPSVVSEKVVNSEKKEKEAEPISNSTNKKEPIKDYKLCRKLLQRYNFCSSY